MGRLLTGVDVYYYANLDKEKTYCTRGGSASVTTFDVTELLEAQDINTSRLIVKEISTMIRDRMELDWEDFEIKYPDWDITKMNLADYLESKYGVKE